MGIVIIIPADEQEPIVTREADEQPSLNELNTIVGGYLEAVPLWDSYMGQPMVVYCNEEGKLDGLPVNVRATIMWYTHNKRKLDDVLVGDVVLVVNLPDKEETG